MGIKEQIHSTPLRLTFLLCAFARKSSSRKGAEKEKQKAQRVEFWF
jgi:hypothetical protein